MNNINNHVNPVGNQSGQRSNKKKTNTRVTNGSTKRGNKKRTNTRVTNVRISNINRITSSDSDGSCEITGVQYLEQEVEIRIKITITTNKTKTLC